MCHSPALCTAFSAEEVIRALALCLFDYHKEDLAAFLKHKKTQKQYANMTPQQILNSLPLSALRRHVRRLYISAEQQAERLQGWFGKYMADPVMAVDPVSGRHIVSGPFKAFETVFSNQLALALEGYLSGEYLSVQDSL